MGRCLCIVALPQRPLKWPKACRRLPSPTLLAFHQAVAFAEQVRTLLAQLFPDKKTAELKDGLYYLRMHSKVVWKTHAKFCEQLNAADSLLRH